MRTHVALLRGINVGGHNKVAMADLRAITTLLGHADVATYIQSGNVVFTSSETDTTKLAASLEAEIARRLGVEPSVVVLSRRELKQVIDDNPYPQEANPRCLHVVCRREKLSSEQLAAVAAAERRAKDKGSPDEVTVIGRTLYLRTPGGFGRSELVMQLSRSKTATMTDRATTARNWATVTELMAMLNE